MLDAKIKKKLESLRQLPTIPHVISEVMQAVESANLSASRIGRLIEKDQALTAKVLSVANSPFYGFSRKISTIDLAVVVIGLNSIKEIILSLFVQKFYAGVRKDVFDLSEFWKYSVFCGACSRLLARKLGYRLAGEAFVAGLMHDIGLLILIQFFTDRFIEVRNTIRKENISMIDAEKKILNCTHCDIGAWIASKWNLPGQLYEALSYHHTNYLDFKISVGEDIDYRSISFAETEQPLTAIVAMTEWFAREMGFMDWSEENKDSPLFLASDILDEIKRHDLLNPESALEALKQEIMEEYQKASVFSAMPVR